MATPTWPDLAAGALTLLADQCLACVCIAEVDPRGVIVTMEAAGAAGTGARGRTHPQVLGLRSAIERLPELGFAVPTPKITRGLTGFARDLLGEGWARSDLARAFSGASPTEIQIGVHALGTGDHERIIAVFVGVTSDESRALIPVRTTLLESVLPLLAQRALLALGSKVSNASRWLTSREQSVLERLTLGKSVREIAEESKRSPHTIHDHVKSLHRKLNASSRGELVARALGYIDDDGHVLGTLSDRQVETKAVAEVLAGLTAVVRGEDEIVEPKPARRAERLDPGR